MNISPINYSTNMNINRQKCANTNFKSSKAIYEAFTKKFPDKVPGEWAAINLDRCPVSGMTWGQQLGMEFVPGNHGLSIGDIELDKNVYKIIPVKNYYRKVVNYNQDGPMFATFGYDLTGTTHQITNG